MMNLVQQCLEKIKIADSAAENLWVNIYDFAKNLNLQSEVEYSSRHIISLNPSNKVILSSNEKLKNSISILSHFISKQANLLKQSPEDIQIWLNLFYSYVAIHDYQNAYTIGLNVLRIVPKYSQLPFCYFMATVNEHFHFNDQALSYFQRAQEINTDCKFRYAILLRRNNQYTRSVDIFKSLLDEQIPGLTNDDIYFQLAFTYQFTDQNDLADEIFQKLLQNFPDNLSLLQQYAWFCAQDNDPSVPTKFCEHYLNSQQYLNFQNDPSIMLAKAHIYLKQGKYEDAYACFRSVISIFHNSFFFWSSLGQLYLENEQFDDASVALQRAIYIKNDNPEIWLNLGLSLEAKDDQSKAEFFYQNGAKNVPKDPRFSKRIQRLHVSPLTRQNFSSDILSLDSKLYFDNEAELQASKYLDNTPFFTSDLFQNDEEVQIALSELIKPHVSLFHK